MKIYSIFSSIHGEANCRGQGSWATFVRTAGCSLGCNYCDTKYAQDPRVGKEMDIFRLIERVEKYKGPYLLITGGEPLEQGEELLQFISLVRTKGFHVTVETNGAYALPPRQLCTVDCYVVDYKLPGAGVGDVFQWANTNVFSQNDVVKFVISDESDYQEAKRAYRRLKQRNSKARCAFSPVLDRLEPAALYYWMLEDNIWDVQLSLQLHKLVKLPEPR